MAGPTPTIAPYQVQNLSAQQSDGNILLTWNGSLGATGYTIQRSTDGVNFTDIATGITVTQYLDSLPGIGIMYYYQIVATNIVGSAVPSTIAQMVAAPPSEMSTRRHRSPFVSSGISFP